MCAHIFYYVLLFFLSLVFLLFFSVGTVRSSTTAPEISYELKLVPSLKEVVRFENESYIVSCHAAANTRLRWLDPDNVWVDKKRGSVHVEQRNNELVLVFASLSADTDNGTWTCQAEMDDQKITFNMIVYSMMLKKKNKNCHKIACYSIYLFFFLQSQLLSLTDPRWRVLRSMKKQSLNVW